jgi:hypothetical protein
MGCMFELEVMDVPVTLIFSKCQSDQVSNFSYIADMVYVYISLTPWNEVLVEKHVAAQLLKKLPVFYVT